MNPWDAIGKNKLDFKNSIIVVAVYFVCLHVRMYGMFVLHPTASLILEDICKGTKTNGDNYKCAYDNEGGGCVLENASVTRYGYYHRELDKFIYTD